MSAIKIFGNHYLCDADGDRSASWGEGTIAIVKDTVEILKYYQKAGDGSFTFLFNHSAVPDSYGPVLSACSKYISKAYYDKIVDGGGYDGDPETINQDADHRFTTDAEKSTWNGKSDLALGETNVTAYRGDRGKTAYDHSQVAHAPSDAVAQAATYTDAEVAGAVTEAESYTDAEIDTLKDGVGAGGDTLIKLYNLILGAAQEVTVATIAARNAYDIPFLPFHIFVTDDGDGNWALYKATTTGVGATFVKISDPDLLNAILSNSQIKVAYESNSDTNCLTNALLAKLNAIAAGATANDTDGNLKARANHTGTQLAATISNFDAAALAAAPAETVNTEGSLINGATSKTTPVDADYVGVMDSAASNILKKLSWANIKVTLKAYFDTLYPSGSGTSSGTNTGDQTTISGNAGSATILQNTRTIDGQNFNGSGNITVIAPGTNAATDKATPVNADLFPIVDTEASNVLKKVTFTNLKAFLKTYFDTLYNLYVHPNHTGDVTSVGGGAQTIANSAVTNTKMADMVQNTVKGRITASTGAPEDLTKTNLQTLLGIGTTSEAFATATTSISAATYADITGASITLAAGTWLILAFVNGSIVNAQAIMHVAITDAANAIVAEGSQGIGASGTTSVAQNGNLSISAIVSPVSSTTYKLRGARGLTTITGTWVAMDGAGTNTTNNLTDNSDKGTSIRAIRVA